MENLLFFGVPQSGRNYSLNIFGLNIVTPKTIDFPFETNGKSMILSVPILKPLGYFICYMIKHTDTHKKKHSFSIRDKWKIYSFRCHRI